jgi:hypothetical protein
LHADLTTTRDYVSWLRSPISDSLFVEIGQRHIGADKFEFPIRSRFINPGVKKLEPLFEYEFACSELVMGH